MSNRTEARAVKNGDHLYLIDGSGYIFRAYHALPPLTRKSDGLPIGAAHGFCAMLHKLLRELPGGVRPTHLAAIFDKSEVTFRNELFDGYKANRPPPPSDLIPQFAVIRQAVRAFNVPCIEQQGYEADDLIATYARQAVERGATVRIVSSDKDLMQLVSEGIKLFDTMKDKDIGESEVLEKFGVPPAKVGDVLALAGDSVDNVPGVPGIGVKTGAQLITEYGDLETLLARASEIKQPKRRECLERYADQARLSRRLVALKDDVPLEHSLESLAVRAPDPKELIGFLKTMEFTTLMRRIATALDADASQIDPLPVRIEGWSPEGTVAAEQADLALGGPESPQRPVGPTAAEAMSPATALETLRTLMRSAIDHAAYETIIDELSLNRWLLAIREQGLVAIDTETNSLDAMQCDLVGISFALSPGKACYVPLAHRKADGLDFGGEAIIQLSRSAVLPLLKPLLEDPAILKVGHNVKYDLQILGRCGIDVAPYDDTMLMSYAMESGLNGHGLDELSEKHLGHKPISFKDVAGSGRSKVAFDLVPLDRATHYAAEDADITLRLWALFKAELVARSKTAVYETLERPLASVLAGMEKEGILVDRKVLARLSSEFAAAAATLEEEIFALAGARFNIGSTKQLGEVLFGRMQLPGGRKTATGAWSTDADTLDDLAAQGLEFAKKVLDWRQLTKLRSTYTDALLAFIHPDTGRVHTSYAMAATSTGRLASTDPNLQNIPVRTEEGRKIRTAFIASPGMKLVSADYSQIELRVLAHVADIPQLRNAFTEGLDIHAMTASEMFGVPIEGMNALVRRRAKAINFGIIYGISAFGLANQLDISREEAGDYIRTYFKRFPGIRDYMDRTKRFCRDNGYVETIFGRRMHFPRIASPNASERAFQERAAINAPIQGSAADIIRRAMIRMPEALRVAGLSSRMLLQVHDELIFEAEDREVETTMAVARSVMEKAPEPAFAFRVPIRVDARAAQNWEEAH
ncbi:MAG TPA: DNA polymerase I [Aestuariivirgaceae bacterium]|jgi:DNA polymerase-1